MSTVTFSPITSILNNYPAGTIVIGRPGSGKTYFLLNIAANCFMQNVKMIFIDFKNDSLALTKINPGLKVTDINNIEPGALNPFKVIKDIDTNTLMSIIKCLCGDLTLQQVNSVSPIVKDFVIENRRNLGNVDFLALTNYLYSSDNEDAQIVGTMLKNHEDSTYGDLIFTSNDETDGIVLGDVSQVITLFGLSIPSPDKSKWNEEDKFTSAVIYIICRMLSDLLLNKKGQPTVLIIDESHIMYSIKEMADIVDRMLVLGRSLNVATVMASQNITHYPKDISQLVANKFMFASSPDQSKEFLDRFDSSEEGVGGSLDRPSIISFMNEVGIDADTKGVCFMIDARNRSGYVKIKSNLGVTSNPLIKNEPKGY